jgi:hypothetical protein
MLGAGNREEGRGNREQGRRREKREERRGRREERRGRREKKITALSPGERVSRCRRFHQPERDG